MKYIGIYWTLFAPMMKKSIAKRFDKELADRAIRQGKAEYKGLLARADDLGPGNPMAMNAYFAYVFAAAWLGSGRKITPDEMALVMTDVLEGRLLRTFFGLTDLNRKPKKWEQDMRKYEAWFAAHGKLSMHVYLAVAGGAVHLPCGAFMWIYKSVAGAAGKAVGHDIAMKYLLYFLLPAAAVFAVFFIGASIVQFVAFFKGRTPFPKWYCVFNLLLGKAVFNGVRRLGNTALINGIGTSNMSLGAIVMFTALLLGWKSYSPEVYDRTEGDTAMIKLQGLSREQVREIASQTADAFYDYRYHDGDSGLIKYIPSREAMFIYIHGIVRAAYKAGVLYTTSDGSEGYLMLSGEGAGGRIGFVDGLKMIAAEKKALGSFGNMKRFINACFCDGGTIETRMRKEKRKFLRVEMLVVRKEYQGQGYMRRMLEYAYRIAEDHRVPVILDTDDRDKAARYEHLGMKLDRVRDCGERFHMYDLIRECETQGGCQTEYDRH